MGFLFTLIDSHFYYNIFTQIGKVDNYFIVIFVILNSRGWWCNNTAKGFSFCYGINPHVTGVSIISQISFVITNVWSIT